jgi:phytoene dehydrogenase-like protein
MSMERYDVAVIGSGFGGLGCALTLAEQGARVALFERLKYPGGCASTFTRRGYKFESGATLFSGFGEGQLFDGWIKRHEMDVEFQAMSPVVELRTEGFTLGIESDRQALIEAFCRMPDAPVDRLRAFFGWQEKIADALWTLFDDPSLLPPFSTASLLRHLSRSPSYLPLVSIVGRSLGDILRWRGLGQFKPLRTYLDAVCQITVQASASEAEAAFALAAMDYYFRGTGHIHGGIGVFAHAVTDAIAGLGGTVFFADEVKGLTRSGSRWQVTSRRRSIEVDTVVANLLPQNVTALLDGPSRADRDLQSLSESVEKGGWGAAMLYLGLDRERLDRPEAFHLEMVDDAGSPFVEGNHIFCSVSGDDEVGRAPSGQRVATLSTHVDMDRLRGLDDEGQAAYIEEVQQAMRRTLARRAPEIDGARMFEMTASPRTFERFTGRHFGYVGGVPRKAGLHHYLRIFPREVAPELYLVGDSVFPGQSILACALGGQRVAERIAARRGLKAATAS